MSLYRLDFHYPDGSVIAVQDRVLDGALIKRNRSATIFAAKETMEKAYVVTEGNADARSMLSQSYILVTRIHGAGILTPSAAIHADGCVRRPPIHH